MMMHAVSRECRPACSGSDASHMMFVFPELDWRQVEAMLAENGPGMTRDDRFKVVRNRAFDAHLKCAEWRHVFSG